ncbi:MAG: preprotein translocase subunit SecG [Candidatus Polarisedimenticolaceae bacterium]|nr:preprotein translocase subunit SecG [Candidatus Polarisedimenticolaceae bacterium]
MQTILVVVHLLLAVAIIGLVLIQHGKGADAGAAFGSGASATVFGAQGSGSFLSRLTGGFAALFFMTSIALAYFATQGSVQVGLMERAAERHSAVPAAVDEVVESKMSEVPTIIEVPAKEASPGVEK